MIAKNRIRPAYLGDAAPAPPSTPLVDYETGATAAVQAQTAEQLRARQELDKVRALATQLAGLAVDVTQKRRLLNDRKAHAAALGYLGSVIQGETAPIGALDFPKRTAYAAELAKELQSWRAADAARSSPISPGAALTPRTPPATPPSPARKGLGDLGDDFDFAASYKGQLDAGQLKKAREDISPACVNSGCAFDPRLWSQIYLTRPSALASFPPAGYHLEAPSLWQTDAPLLQAPWPGEGDPAPVIADDLTLRRARETGDYGYFGGAHTSVNISDLTPSEYQLFQQQRAAYHRSQRAADRAEIKQDLVYAAYAILVVATAGGALGLAPIVPIAVGLAASAAAEGAAGSEGGLLSALHEVDRLALRKLYQTAGEQILKTVQLLDRYVPGWATVIDALGPALPILPLITFALSEITGASSAIIQQVFNAITTSSRLASPLAALGPSPEVVVERLGHFAEQAVADAVTKAGSVLQTSAALVTPVQSTLAKAIATYETTNGDLNTKLIAVGIEVAQGVARVVAIAAVAAAPLSLALYAVGESVRVSGEVYRDQGGDAGTVKALSITSQVIEAIASAGAPSADTLSGKAVEAALASIPKAIITVGQTYQQAEIVKAAAKQARLAADAYAMKLDAITRAMQAEIDAARRRVGAIDAQKRTAEQTRLIASQKPQVSGGAVAFFLLGAVALSEVLS